MTRQGKRGISPSSLSHSHTGLFCDWCDDEQLSSIYREALLGTNKDYPRELDGVIPYNPCGDHHSDVEIFSKFLLDMDHDSCKQTLTKLLSNQVIRKCVQEVLIETGLSQRAAPIISQAKFKQAPVNWLDCIQPYPVDELAFNKHHQGINLGKKRTGPTARRALKRARERVITPLLQAGTIEQQRLTLLKVLSHPSIRDIASSIGVHNTKLGRQFVQCAQKLIKRGKTTHTKNFRTSSTKRSMMRSICVALLPTPTKEAMSEHNQPSTERNISVRELSKQLGFSKGSGQRFLSSTKKKRADVANGLKDGWVMLTDEQA